MMNYVLAIVVSLGILAFFLLWNKPIILIYLEIIFSLSIRLFITQFGFPSFMRYIADLICLYLFLWAIVIAKRNQIKTYAFIPISILLILVIASVITFMAHDYSIGIYIEGMIKMYRYAAFYYSCIIFLNAKEVKKIIRLLFVFLVLNVIVSSIQYFLQGIRWDYNGGFFGIEVGGNGQMNVFLVITSVIGVVMGVKKKFTLMQSGAIVLGGIYIALLSELKIYYVELLIIIILCVMISKPSIRSFVYLTGGTLAIIAAIHLLGKMYPLFADFFNPKTILNYTNNDKYGGGTGNLNRLTALPYVYKNLLKTPVDKWIGIGIGNANDGTVFHSKYKNLKYNWFFSSYYTVENGLLCFILYCMFFISITVSCIYFMQRDSENKEYYLISAVISLFPIIFMIYDGSLLTLVSYVLFLILSLPFIIYREKAKIT